MDSKRQVHVNEILKVLGESANLGSMSSCGTFLPFFEDRLWMVVGLSLTELAKRSIK